MKKIELAKELIKNNLEIFKCPVCSEPMLLKGSSLICLKGHCFDLANKGYLNLLANPVHSKYGKQMLTSRKIIAQHGFFQPLIEQIGDIMLRKIKNKKEQTKFRILDAGCGEGSNLVSILAYLNSKTPLEFIGIGLDISRDGISIASGSYPGNIWVVANLANCPFIDKQFDIIINILSPANYEEFKRILKDSGLFIKVIPGSGYLQEIRKTFYHQKGKQEYYNEKVIALLEKNFNIISRKQLTYKKELSQDELIPIIEMTPLSWSINKEDIRQKRYLEMREITIDLTIIAGIAGSKLIGRNNMPA
jgi:23S rRNA (guanine745-N1)-methyltransferase